MRTDQIGGRPSALHYRHPLVSYISRFLDILEGMPEPKSKRWVWWTPFRAAMAAMLMVLDRGCSLGERFEDARACMAADFPRGKRAGGTYNGLLKALERQAGAVLPALKDELQRQARRRFSQLGEGKRWLLLAVDGSKADLPRTVDLERHFGIADNGATPQALLTAIVEMGTGLLWDWRIDRGRGSEKGHLVRMAPNLPDNALLLGDGNFVGFPVWSRLNDCGKAFLIRVGGNVRLLTRLWPDAETHYDGDIVYVWPKCRQEQSPPLMLRLIKVGKGRKAVHLLTNVLDSRQLPRRDAGKAYRQRWGAELFFRTLKRSLGYHKLQSKAGRRARMELEWALIAMTVMTFMGLASAARRRIAPERLSPAHMLRTLRIALLRGVGKHLCRSCADLARALVAELQDTYERRKPKRSRHCPTTANTPNPYLKPPKIRRATTEERRLARQYREQAVA
jgi:hypothetical protein